MRRRGLVLDFLDINVDIVNQAHSPEKQDFQFGDSTYRHDGFSIGQDYLRYEGTTVTRGALLPKSLSVDKLLGQGAFSKVHRGLWQHKKETIVVAVKQCCILESSPQRRDMLLKELKALCQVDCECLVKFQGAFLEHDTVTMVLEYMDRGSLEQLLHSKQHNDNYSQPFIASVAYQMLWGLSYLHYENILHRDIKPGNVLLHSNGYVKLCDFGIASMSDQSLNTTVVGTTRYMAPERLRAKPYSHSSDLWSLGLVLLELFTGACPWADCDSIIALVVTVEEMSLEELVPETIRGDLRELLLACFHHEPGTLRVDIVDCHCHSEISSKN
jgi:serine/threonine protein kinase